MTRKEQQQQAKMYYNTTPLPSSTTTSSTTTSHRRAKTKTPSFSSVLLDSIDRSIDFDAGGDAADPSFHHEFFSSSTQLPNQTQYQKHNTATSTTRTQITHYDTVTTSNANRLLHYYYSDDKPVNLKRAIMIEHWIEKYQLEEEEQQNRQYLMMNDKFATTEHRRRHSHPHHDDGDSKVYRQKSVPDHRKRLQALMRSTTATKGSDSATARSSFSSPDSFLSSVHGYAAADSHSCFTTPHQIPLNKIRTAFAHRSTASCCSPPRQQSHTPRSRSTSSPKFMARTRSRAVKMYGELKNGGGATKRQRYYQQPNPHAISPGAKIASFLISMFAANKKQQRQQQQDSNAARRTVSDSETAAAARRHERRKPSQSSSSTTSSSSCSSGSSFSRSCLSTKTAPSSSSLYGKTTSSAVKPNRSVRFYPVRSIIDEDVREVNAKEKIRIRSLFDCMVDDEGLKEEEGVVVSMDLEAIGDGEESCASSDLFELNNLNNTVVEHAAVEAITCDEEEQELPLYGTTSLEQNRAIARFHSVV